MIEITAAEAGLLTVQCEPRVGRVERLDIAGPCPRCGDPVHFIVHTHGFDLAAAGGDGGGPAGATIAETEHVRVETESARGQRQLTLNCNCAEQHDANHGGCGAWFAIDVTWEPNADGTLVAVANASSRPITGLEERDAQERDALATGELDRLRSAAGNWRTGLGLLIALVPTLVVVKGTETADKLTSTDKAVVGVLVAVGGVLVVVAAVLAMRAAFGPLSIYNATDDLAALRDDEAKRTVRYLWATALATFVGLAALGTAIGYAWQAPTGEPAYFSVTEKDGSVVCGRLASATDAALRVKTSDGLVRAIRFGDVDSTSFVTGC